MSKKKPQHGVSGDTLASYQKQCTALAQDWQRLHELMRAYRDPGVERARLEAELLALRSRLSCDYPVLTDWRKGGYGLSAGINKMLSNSTELSSLAQTAGDPDSRVEALWREVWAALEKVRGTLAAARAQLDQGREAHLPPELLQHDTHVPFPIRAILKGVAAVLAILLTIAVLYTMRNFLGFWGAETGSTLHVTEGMTQEAKIEMALIVLNEAFRNNDVDRFMTVFADDFRDDEGNGKTALRVALQAFKETGEFKTVAMDWSRIKVTERGDVLDVRPVFIILPDEEISIHLGFKPYGDKLLIATGSST